MQRCFSNCNCRLVMYVGDGMCWPEQVCSKGWHTQGFRVFIAQLIDTLKYYRLPPATCFTDCSGLLLLLLRIVLLAAVLRRTLIPTQHLIHKLQDAHAEREERQRFLSALTVGAD